MTRINGDGNIKAMSATKAADDETTAADDFSTARSEALARIEEALRELDKIDIKYLSAEYFQRHQFLKATLSAQAASVRAFAFQPDGYTQPVAHNWDITELEKEGWNGVVESKDPGHAAAVGADYAGTLDIPSTGWEDPTICGLQMTDDMKEVYGVSHGRDIWVTIVDKKGKRKTYVIKDGTVRLEPIVISAHGLKHDVKIDFSRAIRVNDGRASEEAYKNQVFSLIGGDGNDTIIGSQGNDYIMGGLGDDKLYGMNGDDTIFGDLGHNLSEGYDKTAPGGKDYIDGGEGMDTVYAGGGIDTYVSREGDSVLDGENSVAVSDQTLPSTPLNQIVQADSNWDVDSTSEPGTIVVSNTSGKGGEITMNMPDGYTMATAKRTADGSLLVTYSGIDANGNPRSFKVRIEDFFLLEGDPLNPGDVVELNFFGGFDNDIINFGDIEVTGNQVINIRDNKGGDDVIIGAKTALLSDGINPDDLTNSSCSTGVLGQTVNNGDGIFADNAAAEDKTRSDGYMAKVETSADGDRQIVIYDDDESGAPPPGDTINLNVPDGYDKGYITMDEDNNYFVILVKRNSDGTTSTIVVKIDQSITWHGAAGVKPTDIHASGLTLMPITNTAEVTSAYEVSGGQGRDLVVMQEGSRHTDTADEVVIIKNTYTPTTKPETPETDLVKFDTNNNEYWEEDEWKAFVEDKDGKTMTDEEWEDYKKNNTNPYPKP